MPRIRNCQFFFALACFVVLLSGCKEIVINDLDEPSANQILSALEQQGINALKEKRIDGRKTTYTISVNQGQSTSARTVLQELGLPKPKRPGIVDVFGEPGMLPTTTQEQALLTQALMGEIAQTIERIDGIQEARVHLVLPEKHRFGSAETSNSTSPKASVLIKAHNQYGITEEQIQKLVAGGIAGLTPHNVTVIVSRSSSSVSAAKPTQSLVKLGPFWVASQSKTGLWISVTVLLLLVVGLALFATFLRRKMRQIQTAQSRVRDAQLSDSSLSMIQSSVSVRRRE